ncbi:uncharacterized protein LOC142590470 isoform X2 [Dermacentor variabilis]|uniref:uncharacterized protein LOC142590470 isoform X2 n=1 Tax=Dermacentor variabilis TaxID=34621 RepID=UPI003F5B249E
MRFTISMSLAESIPAKMECHTPSKVIGQFEVGVQYSLPLADKSIGCCFKAWSESRSVQTTQTLEQLSSTSGFTNAMSLAESVPARMECHTLSKVVGQVEVGMQCSLPQADKSVGCCFKAWSESRSVQTTETLEQLTSTSGFTNAMSPSESVPAKMECHSPSKVVGQVEVGMQYSLPLADKSVGCCFKAWSESRSVQTTETLEQLTSTSGFTNAMSLAESVPAEMECHTPSKVVGQVEVGMQCSLPLADKSVGICFKAWSKSRSVQTTETLEQLTSTSASRPRISPSTATCDNSKQGFLHQCDYEADKLAHLDAHANIPTGKKPCQCPSCSRSFSRKSDLKIHLRTHTGEKPFQCPSCLKSFSQKTTMKSHLRTHTGEKPYQCPSCSLGFSRKFHLNEHLHTHTGEKPYHCPSCLQSFSLRTSLKNHLRTHTGEKPYQCPSCSQSFSQKIHLKVHLCTHTGEKPFQCPSCSRGFSQKFRLNEHLRTHTGEKPYQCPSCSRGFSRKFCLNEHLRTHTGEKPYRCPSCLKSFSQNSSLKAHLRIHTGEKPYQCTSCSRSFSQKNRLNEHLHTHTGENIPVPSMPSELLL